MSHNVPEFESARHDVCSFTSGMTTHVKRFRQKSPFSKIRGRLDPNELDLMHQGGTELGSGKRLSDTGHVACMGKDRGTMKFNATENGLLLSLICHWPELGPASNGISIRTLKERTSC